MPHVIEIDHVNRYRIRWDDSFARIAKEKQRRHEDDSVVFGVTRFSLHRFRSAQTAFRCLRQLKTKLLSLTYVALGCLKNDYNCDFVYNYVLT